MKQCYALYVFLYSYNALYWRKNAANGYFIIDIWYRLVNGHDVGISYDYFKASPKLFLYIQLKTVSQAIAENDHEHLTISKHGDTTN